MAPSDLSDLDAHLPAAAEIALWQTLAKRISDPGFGIRSGAEFRLRSLGLLGYVVRFSADLRAALHRIERYSRIFTEAVQFRLEVTKPIVSFTINHSTLGAGLAFAEDYRITAVLKTSRELTGVDLMPLAVSFTHRPPTATLAHREFFRCPIHFEAAAARLQFRPADLDLPIAKADETLAGYLSQQVEHVLATMLHGETVRCTTRAAIWSLIGEGTPSLERVAATLQLPARTLQRRLAAERTTFQRELEEVRKSMATATLRDPSIPIGDVAFLLGYSDASTFYRSFRRWTGTTPRRFRSAAA